MNRPFGGPGDPGTDRALEPLVARTRGGQPWRRVFHALTGVTLATLLVVWAPPRSLALALLSSATVLAALLDVARLRIPALNVLFFRAFTSLASPREARGPASSTWYLLAVTLAVAIFPLPAAISGILVLALADPAASWVGRRWGRRPFLGGSVEGTLVFLLVAGAVLLVRHPAPAALAAAVLAALAERRSWPLDDNLAVPLVTAAALTLLGG